MIFICLKSDTSSSSRKGPFKGLVLNGVISKRGAAASSSGRGRKVNNTEAEAQAWVAYLKAETERSKTENRVLLLKEQLLQKKLANC